MSLKQGLGSSLDEFRENVRPFFPRGQSKLSLITFFFFFTIAKDCTERLSAVALSLGLIILGGQCVSGHVVQASFVSDTPDRNALTITVQLAFTI